MNPQILYDIFEKVAKSRTAGHDVIKLNIGEPEQSPPKRLFSAINESFKRGRITYGPAAGDPQLRSLLAKEHKVKPENILVGPGSKFLIYATLKTLATDKNLVIVPLPAWSAFSLMFKDLGLKNIKHLKTNEQDGWEINIQDLIKLKNKNSGILILTSPNNPTSSIIKPSISSEIKRYSEKNNIFIIKDCAYQALTFNKNVSSKIDLDSSVEIHSFSKKFCMTGFRIGYIIAKKQIIETLTKYMQITISNVPLFIQDGALELLKHESDFPKQVAKVYQDREEKVAKLLKKAGITFVAPSAAFYIFANLKRPTEKFCLNLVDKGVAVVPGSAFGPYPNYVRISLTEREDRLIKGIKILVSSL